MVSVSSSPQAQSTVHHHGMPFGTRWHGDGRVTFQLWAPTADGVALWLNVQGQETTIPLEPQRHPQYPNDGAHWYFHTAAGIEAGTQYGFVVNGELRVPDPASRYQVTQPGVEPVHGPSVVVNPDAYHWTDADWHGRPWEETVLYELHVGTFTPEGTYRAIIPHLDRLADLGVTAIELMPLSDFPGNRNWGYDGVLHFAPAHCYGTPDDLKALINEAHARRMMVFLDVVYNHFGPDGNYLYVHSRDFFTDAIQTPWGSAIDFSGPHSRTVRDFFIHNTLYWLNEYRFDGLRFDAVHAITDTSTTHILHELAQAVHDGPGKDRYIHLVLENDDNTARYLTRAEGEHRPNTDCYVAQWNDDSHHAYHTLLTGESEGYYQDYVAQDDLQGKSAALYPLAAKRPIDHFARIMASGFAYQGEASVFRNGEGRGEPSRHLPPTAFVQFLQNHDQVGNRAFGERLTALVKPPGALQAAMAWLCLSPQIPMLFMGEEWGAEVPFYFFCNLSPELARSITEGRRSEFSKFKAFQDPEVRDRIPDPIAEETFQASFFPTLDALKDDASAQAWSTLIRQALQARRTLIIPRLSYIVAGTGRSGVVNDNALWTTWRTREGGLLWGLLNLGEAEVTSWPALLASVDDHRRLEGRVVLDSLPGDGTASYDGAEGFTVLPEVYQATHVYHYSATTCDDTAAAPDAWTVLPGFTTIWGWVPPHFVESPG